MADWEQVFYGVGPTVRRMAVPGGWLYTIGDHRSEFVPDNSAFFAAAREAEACPSWPDEGDKVKSPIDSQIAEANQAAAILQDDKVKPFDVADTAAALHGALRFLDHDNEQFARELIESVIKTLEGE